MSKAEDDAIEAEVLRQAGVGAPPPAAVVLPGDQVAIVLEAIDASIDRYERLAHTKIFATRQRCLAKLNELRRARNSLAP